MKTTIIVSAGNYAQEMAAGFEKIQASVIVSKEKILRMLAMNDTQDVEQQAKTLMRLLQERGELDCNIIFYHQDQRNPKDSRDHLVIQFILDIPLPSPAQIRSEIKI